MAGELILTGLQLPARAIDARGDPEHRGRADDAGMLEAAAIGIAILGEEGLAVEALLQADIVTANIFDALSLLEFPTRLVATLRK